MHSVLWKHNNYTMGAQDNYTCSITIITSCCTCTACYRTSSLYTINYNNYYDIWKVRNNAVSCMGIRLVVLCMGMRLAL